MRSVRFDKELDRRLDEAAKACGEPVSAFIRDAVRRRCDQVLETTLERRLADVVGSVAGRRSNCSSRTGEAFKRLLQRKRKRQA